MSGIEDGAEPAPLLKAVGMTKAFGATVALESFDFTLMPGQIHALIGENGAASRPSSRCLPVSIDPISVPWKR
jgi:ABC-type branched-subunit amino acid transport system ATPase component